MEGHRRPWAQRLCWECVPPFPGRPPPRELWDGSLEHRLRGLCPPPGDLTHGSLQCGGGACLEFCSRPPPPHGGPPRCRNTGVFVTPKASEGGQWGRGGGRLLSCLPGVIPNDQKVPAQKSRSLEPTSSRMDLLVFTGLWGLGHGGGEGRPGRSLRCSRSSSSSCGVGAGGQLGKPGNQIFQNHVSI